MSGKRGRLIVVSGPSGAGKSTIIERVRELAASGELDADVRFSVSATTREPRPGEVNGREYHFVTRERFEELIAEGELLEYAEFVNGYYGTPRSEVDQALEEGGLLFLDIEANGAARVRELYPETVSVYIAPPNLEVLRERLLKRETENNERPNVGRKRTVEEIETMVEGRIDRAIEDSRYIENFDYIVINEERETALEEMLTIVRDDAPEELRMEHRLAQVERAVH